MSSRASSLLRHVHCVYDITLTDESFQQHFLEVLTGKLKGYSINKWSFLKSFVVSSAEAELLIGQSLLSR